jgi:hypothetical protein
MILNLRKGIWFGALLGWMVVNAAPRCWGIEPTAAAVSAFNTYLHVVETRLSGQHRAQSGFLPPVGAGRDVNARLRNGELIVEKLTAVDLNGEGAMVHDWRGAAFVKGATGEDFERLMKDFNAYPQRFGPQVVRARVLTGHGDDLRVVMRVRQKHVITVVMDTTYDIEFARLDAQHGWSDARSTQIDEVDGAGTKSERALSGAEEHGFLWRLNTYWSYEERDGGLYMQIESVSLTRAVPHGLGWVVGPFVESVPRESLELTLRSVCGALRK